MLLKDHKPNFQFTLPHRLINPSKSKIGKVNKPILDRFNQNLQNTYNLINEKFKTRCRFVRQYQ